MYAKIGKAGVIAVGTGVLASSVWPLAAAPGGGWNPRGGNNTTQRAPGKPPLPPLHVMERELNLSEAQRTQIQAILERSQKEIAAVLTPEQRQQAEQMRPPHGRPGGPGGPGGPDGAGGQFGPGDERGPGGRPGGPGRGPRRGPSVEELTEILDLTPAQAQQIKALFEQGEAQTKPLREQMDTLREQQHQKLLSILTVEQREKFEDMRPPRGPRGGGPGGFEGNDGPPPPPNAPMF